MGKLLCVVLFCGVVAGRTFASETSPSPGPVLRGTINVVLADQLGIVVLTDSMVSEVFSNEHGIRISRQRTEPGQKLFRIDDRTVCTIAGFAAAGTPSLPDFLNSASAIMGRYEDRLKNSPPLSVSDKLKLLEIVFSHYLKGIANIRDSMSGEKDYYFELLIAGYDPDGTPEVGRLILQIVSEEANRVNAEKVFRPVTLDRRVFPVLSGQPLMFLPAGISDVAERLLNSQVPWKIDEAVATYEESVKLGKPLTIEQMKALAISLKQHTADAYKEVGGPNQIAVLSADRVQSFEQPSFPPIPLVGFKFQIFTGMTMNAGATGLGPKPYGIIVSGGFPLFFKNTFTGVQQILDDSYYAGNVFRDCRLIYNGGRVAFETSNQVIDSDLIIGPKARKDSPEIEQLRKNFMWRTVKSPTELPKASGAGMFVGPVWPPQPNM